MEIQTLHIIEYLISYKDQMQLTNQGIKFQTSYYATVYLLY